MVQDKAIHRVVILTALAVEYQAVRTHITNLHEVVHPNGTIYEQGTLTTSLCHWEIALAQTHIGSVRAALEAERLIAYFKPSVAFFVGTAGGLKQVNIGDVVAARKIYGYESGKAQTIFLPRPELGLSTYRMVQRAIAEARKQRWIQRITPLPQSLPQVFVAPIAAGDKVLSSRHSPLWKLLQRYYDDALIVEMESYGFFQAIHANHPLEALVVRGVSNLLEEKTTSDMEGAQALAAGHASAFAFEVLSQLQPDDFASASTAMRAPNSPPHQRPHAPTYQIHQQTHSGPLIAPIGDRAHVTIHPPSRKQEG